MVNRRFRMELVTYTSGTKAVLSIHSVSVTLEPVLDRAGFLPLVLHPASRLACDVAAHAKDALLAIQTDLPQYMQVERYQSPANVDCARIFLAGLLASCREYPLVLVETK